MRCNMFKRATQLLALLVPATFAATYTLTTTFEGDLYYAIYDNSDGTWAKECARLSRDLRFNINSRRDLPNYELNVYTDEACQTHLIQDGVSFSDLFPTSQQARITVSNDGTWSFTSGRTPTGPGVNPGVPGGDNPGNPGEDNPGGNPGGDVTVGEGMKVIAFFTPWTNTNAQVYVDGAPTAMIPLDNYCGWFIAAVKAPTENFGVYFKQTIGGNFVGANGLTATEPTIATEIKLDSVAALSDTVWVKGNQEGEPGVYAEHPAGILGDCPVKKLPVMMFDWLHGSKGDTDREGRNGDPANGISADFGSGGCSASPMRGMVDTQLGANGVPVPATPFPENCKITDHLAYWFLPESLAVDAQGNKLTNMTCRDLYISMDKEGFWLAEISKDAISKGNEANRGGMFLLDDFQYLDEAGTIPNPYFDQLTGGSDNKRHNFGFTMKVHATFEYIPGQYFDFLGDDDVWVFINNKLVVDIGGQHAQVSGAVDLDTLGLTPGETYPFHIFYAERHTSSSNFRMHTSIDLKTEASIMLKNPTNDPSVIDREVWQKIRKNKLACDFSSGEKELTLERGSSIFTLFGGNLPSNGVELDTAGMWFGGITVNKEFDTFRIDKESIKDNRGLAPGTYYLRVTLRSDNTQYKDVYFVVGAYALPNIVYTDSTGKVLGSTVRSDSLPLNMNKNVVMWVGQSYKVYVQYAEDWANDDVVYPTTNDAALIPCDSLGNPITEVKLVNGKGSFYVKAVGELWGGALYVKGQASGNTAIWNSINFQLPPVPQIELAQIFDRDGDGRGDSIWMKFDGTLGGKNALDSVKFIFNSAKNARFSNAYKAIYRDGSNEASIVANGSGFNSAIFTGDSTGKVYTGLVKVWYTYTDNGKRSVFPADGALQDQIGPIVTKAEVSYMKDGNTQLELSFSEAIQNKEKTSDIFNFHVWNNGIMSTAVKSASDISATAPNQWTLIFPKGNDNDFIPAVGDSVRFAPTMSAAFALDMVNVGPHANNPWVRITGEQKVNVTSPGVVKVDPGSASYDSAKTIITSESATVPKVIQDPSILNAEQAAAAYGTQGHFLGDLNMAELVENEIEGIKNAVQNFEDKVIVVDQATGATQSYSIEQIIAAVDNGQMSIDDAKKKFDLDPVIVDAYKNHMIDSKNVSKYNSGSERDIQEIVEAVAQSTELRYEATYYSSLGEFVNSYSNVITCNDDVFKDHGQGTCLENNGKLFLAWNMRAKNGRLVSTGVYIARLAYRIKVGSKTVVDRTQDFLWGVRRGKANALDLGF